MLSKMVPLAVVAAGLLALARGAPRVSDARALGPADDEVVLEKLAGPRPARPADPARAAEVAREQILLARATADPRHLGRAQAALARFWHEPSPPHEILVLRATIKQANHDFAGALADLGAALGDDPDDPQALLTQAVLLQVRGDLDGARESCRRLAPLAPPLVGATCRASVDGATGRAAAASEALAGALAGERDPILRGWSTTLLAELLARQGRAAEAEAGFRAALASTPDDTYLLGAFADFLLDAGRPAEAAALLAGRTADNLLLRRALAAARAGAPDAARLGEEIGGRYRAARARGDRIHLREEARFLLELGGDPGRALAVAVENFAVQREPADLRLLLDAALAAGDRAAARPALELIARTGLDDPRLAALARRLETP
jgi:predicted Zn-dependent protease